MRPDGTVKVLDFGLAKAMDPAGASRADAMNSPTLTCPRRRESSSAQRRTWPRAGAGGARRQPRRHLGIRRRAVRDAHREASVRRRDHQRNARGGAARRPRLDGAARARPERIRRLLRRCLDRDVKQRLQAIGEARIVLDSADDWTGSSASSVRSPSPPSGRSPLLWWAASALVAVVAAGSGMVARAAPTFPLLL